MVPLSGALSVAVVLLACGGVHREQGASATEGGRRDEAFSGGAGVGGSEIEHAGQSAVANCRTHFPVFWQHTAVRGVTLWGWIVGRTWISGSGLVEGTTPRPAMNWLMTELGRPVLAP